MMIDLRTVFKILHAALVLSMLLLFSSCDIQKNFKKSKSDAGFSENIESRTFRKGDTVHYEIPNVIYKDTVIYRVNRQGTTIKTVYDQTGKVASIDCFASAIDEMRKENRQFQESMKDKSKEKTENFDSSFILYIVGGFAVIVMFGFFLMFLYIKQNSKVVTTVLQNLSK